jgi:predicted lipoprotein with Yx(FWY)xxD motif
MRTTTSAAAAVKASAPAKTNPITRFKTIILFSFYRYNKAANQASGRCAAELTSL